VEAQFNAVESLKSIENNYGPEVTREVVQIFIKDYPAKIQKLKHVIEQGNLEAIRFQAHDIKSGCLSMGVKPMSEICEKIERDTAKFSKEDLVAMTETLETDYNQISKDFSQYLGVTVPFM
jgi:HPt (histidine-containing phosphotransfer) domain-containing protein